MRYILAVILSATTVLGLLLIMSNLVSASSSKGESKSGINVYQPVTISDETIRKIRKPKEPERPKSPDVEKTNPAPPKPKTTPSLPTLTLTDVATDVDTSFQVDLGTDISMPTTMRDSFDDSDGSLTAKVQIEPMYPHVAREKGLEGSVTLSFDVNENGHTQNIKVVKAEPARVFDQAAKKALRKWRYNPEMKDGKAVLVTGQMITLAFSLEKS